MHRAVFSLVMLVAIGSFPANAQNQFKGPELFPAGNFVGTYRVQYQGQEDKLVVYQAPDQIGIQRCWRYEGLLRNQLISTEHLAVRADGVYRIRHDDADLEPPLLICKFPPVKGETWTGDYKINDKKSTVHYQCNVEEMSVMKNPKATTVLVIRAEITFANVTLTNTCWYAPNRGLVKQVIEEGNSKIILELDSHGPASRKAGPKAPSP
jgi:hypothetical protein